MEPKIVMKKKPLSSDEILEKASKEYGEFVDKFVYKYGFAPVPKEMKRQYIGLDKLSDEDYEAFKKEYAKKTSGIVVPDNIKI